MMIDEYILEMFKLLPREIAKALIFLYLRDENFREIMRIAYEDQMAKLS